MLDVGARSLSPSRHGAGLGVRHRRGGAWPRCSRAPARPRLHACAAQRLDPERYDLAHAACGAARPSSSRPPPAHASVRAVSNSALSRPGPARCARRRLARSSSPASAIARATYSAIDGVTSSGNPTACSRLAATRPANVCPEDRQHRTAGPQRIARRRVRVVRPCVEEQVRVAVEREVIGIGSMPREHEPLGADAARLRLAPQVGHRGIFVDLGEAATARTSGTARRIAIHASNTSGLILYVWLKLANTKPVGGQAQLPRGRRVRDRALAVVHLVGVGQRSRSLPRSPRRCSRGVTIGSPMR